MTPIPPKLRAEMAEDPWYKKCCLAELGDCGGRIEWHHVIIYAGKQLQEKWAIVPACHDHHYRAAELNEYFLFVVLSRATLRELRDVSKAVNYMDMKERLMKVITLQPPHHQ